MLLLFQQAQVLYHCAVLLLGPLPQCIVFGILILVEISSYILIPFAHIFFPALRFTPAPVLFHHLLWTHYKSILQFQDSVSGCCFQLTIWDFIGASQNIAELIFTSCNCLHGILMGWLNLSATETRLMEKWQVYPSTYSHTCMFNLSWKK